MSKKENIVNQITHHSLEVKLAKSLKRSFEKLKPATKALLGSESHKSLVNITELTVTLQLEIDRHMKMLVILSTTLLKMSKLTTEIDAESIVPFKLKDIQRGYVEIKAPVNSKGIKISGTEDYYIILNLGEILKGSNSEIEFILHEAYSQVPKGYTLLLLL